MSAAMLHRFERSVSMSTSTSSIASQTPGSEHTSSVLDFSQRCAAPHQQQFAPSSCKRKRCPEVGCRDEHQQALCYQKDCTLAHCQPSKHFRKQLLPGSQSAACSPENTAYNTAVYNCLLQWCYRLKALQPKCIITSDVLHRALDLFHRFSMAVATQSRDQTHLTAERLTVHAAHLAGCFWIAAKNDGNRSCVPSRTLVTKAISVQPEDLSQAELTVCCKLKWNIFNSQVALPCFPAPALY